MAFPFTVNPAAPAGTDSASGGDDELRAIKQALVDLFGLPASPTNITASIMDVNADGTVLVPPLIRLGTITDQRAILDGSASWNDAAEAFTAILENITDTNSAATSKLIDLQVGGVSKFAVSKAGAITALSANSAIQTPGARVTGNAQSMPGGFTDISFTGERYDTDAIHDNAVNPTRLTCKTAGKYLIVGQVEWATNATGDRGLGIRKNGANFFAVNYVKALSGIPTYQIVSTILDLTVNDYVTLAADQSSGAGLFINASSDYSPEFMMQRIG